MNHHCTTFLVCCLCVILGVLPVAFANGLSTATALQLEVECGSPSAQQFSSVEAARDHIRTLQPLRQDIIVTISGKCTPTNPNAPVLDLDSPLDGGDENFSITYTGPATLTGGVKLTPTAWTKSTNPKIPKGGNVYQQDLKPFLSDLGELGYGAIKNGGLGACEHTKLELFANGQPMVLARTPNVGSLVDYNGPWMDWLYVGLTLEKEQPNSFVVDNAAVATFLDTDSVEVNRVWLHGFWKYDWADNYIALANISSERNLGMKGYRLSYNPDTPPEYAISPFARFYAVNSISMLDAVGEYFIDEAANVVYFYVDNDRDLLKSATLNAAGKPLISIGAPLRNIHFKNLNLEYSRTHGIAMNASVANASLNYSSITNVSVVNMGQQAMTINADNSKIDSIVAKNIGCRAVSVSGGVKSTLQMANTVVSNSEISVYARKTRTYNAGIDFSGVGLTIEHNFVHNAPHQGMTGGGNNLMFQHNHFDNLCWEVRDSGAWYIGRSWVTRGIVIQNNLFTRIVHVEPTFLGTGAIQAIYLDDEMSGVQIINNTMINIDQGIAIGGGRDNYVSGNVCKNASGMCIAFDNRGMNWQKAICTPPSGGLVQGLLAVNYQQPPYSTEYPQLPGLLKDRPCVPVNNTFTRNFACNALRVINQDSATIRFWGSSAFDNSFNTTC